MRTKSFIVKNNKKVLNLYSDSQNVVVASRQLLIGDREGDTNCAFSATGAYFMHYTKL